MIIFLLEIYQKIKLFFKNFHTKHKKVGGLAVIAIYCLRSITLRPILSDSLPFSTFYWQFTLFLNFSSLLILFPKTIDFRHKFVLIFKFLKILMRLYIFGASQLHIFINLHSWFDYEVIFLLSSAKSGRIIEPHTFSIYSYLFA